LSRLTLLGRRALPALLVALLAAGAATPAGASLPRPDVARLAGDARPAVDFDRLAASGRSDPAPAALSDEAHSVPVVGPVLDPDPAPDLAPALVGVLIPLDELALPPALDPMNPPPGVVVGLCRRDVAAVSGSSSSETRLRGKIEPEAAQPQAISIFSCLLAAGSSHTPYGEAHAETGPELLRARYDNGLSEASTADGTVTQTVADDTTAAPGGIRLSWSIPLDEATLTAGLVVEQLQAGAGWTAVPAGELAIGHRPDDGTSTGDHSTNLRVLLASGWQRGTSYRIRLTQALTDRLGRSYAQDQAQDLQWSITAASATGPTPPVQYDQRFPADYESYQAAGATAGGRFPGGQSRLFQGLLTDPVTGMSYARARWYDARNAHWLSEDPMGAVDSTNLYAFVGWQPNMGTDPMGLLDLPKSPGDVQAFNSVVDQWVSRFPNVPFNFENRGVQVVVMTLPDVSVVERSSGSTFTHEALTQDTILRSETTINTNRYDFTMGGFDPVGIVIAGGKVVGGQSAPDSFYFAWTPHRSTGGGGASTAANPADAWEFGQGDPPRNAEVGVGGAFPVIINGLPYGVSNKYKQGAPAGLPGRGDPGPSNRQYLVQRSNFGFESQHTKLFSRGGKVVMGIDRPRQLLFLMVQEQDAKPGMSLPEIRDSLALIGVTDALSWDGSDSATLVRDNRVVVKPGLAKDVTIPFGVQFQLPQSQ
jgi:RHS repeat-associated protein